MVCQRCAAKTVCVWQVRRLREFYLLAVELSKWGLVGLYGSDGRIWGESLGLGREGQGKAARFTGCAYLTRRYRSRDARAEKLGLGYGYLVIGSSCYRHEEAQMHSEEPLFNPLEIFSLSDAAGPLKICIVFSCSTSSPLPEQRHDARP